MKCIRFRKIKAVIYYNVSFNKLSKENPEYCITFEIKLYEVHQMARCSRTRITT